MGIALDAALKPVILENRRIVRINATRLLAVACKTGATAHYPTLIEILKNIMFRWRSSTTRLPQREICSPR